MGCVCTTTPVGSVATTNVSCYHSTHILAGPVKGHIVSDSHLTYGLNGSPAVFLTSTQKSCAQAFTNFALCARLRKYRKREPDQLKFLREWEVPLARTLDDALKILNV